MVASKVRLLTEISDEMIRNGDVRDSVPSDGGECDRLKRKFERTKIINGPKPLAD